MCVSVRVCLRDDDLNSYPLEDDFVRFGVLPLLTLWLMAVPIWFNGLISRFNRPYSPLPLILFVSKRLSPLILFERVTSGAGDIDTCFRDIELNDECLCFGLTPMELPPLPLLVVVDDDVLLFVFSDVSRGKLDGRTTIAVVIAKRSQNQLNSNYDLSLICR